MHNFNEMFDRILNDKPKINIFSCELNSKSLKKEWTTFG